MPLHHGDPNVSHTAMLRAWIWRDFVNIILGVWLIATPFIFDHRETALLLSDIASGGIIVVLGLLTLAPRFDLARWGICLTGIWLLFAPLVFWTRESAAYANDTLIGSLVIAFSVLIPMMPSRAHHEVMMMPGPDTPSGWSYNPSDWIQRGPIIAMAFVGFLLSRYLAAFQLGHIPYPWDPFFGDGTRRVLESDVSKAWPISDAGLGAVSYLLEALSGFMGGPNRWRTMPWMVIMFGLLVVPVGIVSIVLVILQPVAVGSWCTLCLVTAATMLVMIAPAFDEVVATLQFLGAAKREGEPLWRTFWIGGTLESTEPMARRELSAPGPKLRVPSRKPRVPSPESRAPSPEPRVQPPARSVLSQIIAAVNLDNVGWNLPIAAAFGVWIMFTPTMLGTTGPAADSDHVAGALAVTWAVISFGEIARPVRLLNVPIGLWLMIAPWLLMGATDLMLLNDTIVGAALVVLSVRRGRIRSRFGGWNRFLI